MFSLSKEIFDTPVGEKEKFTKGRGVVDTRLVAHQSHRRLLADVCRYIKRGLSEVFNVSGL